MKASEGESEDAANLRASNCFNFSSIFSELAENCKKTEIHDEKHFTANLITEIIQALTHVISHIS